MIRLYFIGLGILIIAIVANAIIDKIGVRSWYDFINLLVEYKTSAINKLSVLDFIWLFVGYPFVLALGYLAGLKLYNLIF